jgi:hypothetical protein
MKRWSVAIVVTLIVVLGVWWAGTSSGHTRHESLLMLKPKIAPTANAAYCVALKNHLTYRRNGGWWSLAFFGCTFGAALMSAASGIVLKLDILKSKDRLRNDLAAILAGVAALLITLSTIGNFEGKWRANRLAASAVESAVYDLAAGADEQGVLSRLREINIAQDNGIAGAPGATSR